MVNPLPLGTSDMTIEKSQVWQKWRPAVLNLTIILFSCYLQNTMRGIISPSTFTDIWEQIEEGIRGITLGDWAKYVEHVLSVERVYILVKGDRGRGRS